MAKQSFEFVAEPRGQMNRGENKRLRKSGKIPAVIYGGGKPAQSAMLIHKDVAKMLENEAVFSRLLDLKFNHEEVEKVILKGLQRHAYKPQIVHMDFQRVNPNEKLTMNIPIHFLGEEDSAALKSGGVFSHLMTELEVRCLPADIPEYIEIDVSALEMGDSVHLSEIRLPKDVEWARPLDKEHDLPVVSLHIPKVVEEEVTPVVEAVAEGTPEEPEKKTEAK